MKDDTLRSGKRIEMVNYWRNLLITQIANGAGLGAGIALLYILITALRDSTHTTLWQIINISAVMKVMLALTGLIVVIFLVSEVSIRTMLASHRKHQLRALRAEAEVLETL